MCGISGLVLGEGERAPEELLRRMARTMINRGPDAEGVFVDGNAGLSHRRLKIIDLSAAANQPMFNEDGSVVAVFNGEIYNFRELRRELEGRGHRFASLSDTEVIIHAFEEWGEQAFGRLNGMFAFALWDRRKGKRALYLVRDRFGIKPLFYCVSGGKLAFASELKPLLELPWVGRDVRNETLFYFLKFSHIPGDRSILESVNQLRPGTWLRFEAGAATTGVYWDAKALSDVPKDERATEKEQLERLERTLRRVVERQIVSDVPLGCFLSGGIDSSLLVMAYAGLGERTIKTFTIGYRESEFDESAHAREVARHFGTDHHEIIVEPDDLIDFIAETPRHFDQPFADPTLVPSLLLSRFTRQNVTVALSGDGGDELFFGYPHERALLWLRTVRHAPRAIRRTVFEALGRVAAPFSHRAGKLLEILQFSDEAELLQYFVGTIGPMRMDRLSKLMAEPPQLGESLYRGMLGGLADLPWEEKITQVFVRTFLTETVLTKTDRAGMAYGLEARVPFLDDEMVAFSAQLPFRMKYGGGTSKYLLRRLLETRLPGHLSRRPKQGFTIPMRDWLRGDLKYLLDEYLNEPRLRRGGHFAPGEVKKIVRAHLSGRSNYSHLLWSLVSFEMWKETYLS